MVGTELDVLSQEWLGRVQEWENSAHSIGVCLAIVVGCWYPHIFVAFGFVALFFYGLHKQPPDAGAVPW